MRRPTKPKNVPFPAILPRQRAPGATPCFRVRDCRLVNQNPEKRVFTPLCGVLAICLAVPPEGATVGPGRGVSGASLFPIPTASPSARGQSVSASAAAIHIGLEADRPIVLRLVGWSPGVQLAPGAILPILPGKNLEKCADGNVIDNAEAKGVGHPVGPASPPSRSGFVASRQYNVDTPLMCTPRYLAQGIDGSYIGNGPASRWVP